MFEPSWKACFPCICIMGLISCQIRVLLERANAVSKLWDDAPIVLCGDFNCTPEVAFLFIHWIIMLSEYIFCFFKFYVYIRILDINLPFYCSINEFWWPSQHLIVWSESHVQLHQRKRGIGLNFIFLSYFSCFLQITNRTALLSCFFNILLQLDLSELARDKISGQASAEIGLQRSAYPDFMYIFVCWVNKLSYVPLKSWQSSALSLFHDAGQKMLILLPKLQQSIRKN